jgi:hypothetical protein
MIQVKSSAFEKGSLFIHDPGSNHWIEILLESSASKRGLPTESGQSDVL